MQQNKPPTLQAQPAHPLPPPAPPMPYPDASVKRLASGTEDDAAVHGAHAAEMQGVGGQQQRHSDFPMGLRTWAPAFS